VECVRSLPCASVEATTRQANTLAVTNLELFIVPLLSQSPAIHHRVRRPMTRAVFGEHADSLGESTFGVSETRYPDRDSCELVPSSLGP
jgi:hypothetical protein